MGLLTTGGRPLDWGEELFVKAIPHIKEHAITQLLLLYNANKNAKVGMPFLWGEEIEMDLCVIDSDGAGEAPGSPNAGRRTTRLALRAKDFLDRLQTDENGQFLVEYGSYMVETTPKKPYNLTLEALASVQDNQQYRYDRLARLSREIFDPATHKGMRIAAVTLVSFPLLGVADTFIADANGDADTTLKPLGRFAKSLFIPDECTNQSHPRFSYLTQNIRLRRERKVCIQIPMFVDVHTLERTVDPKCSIDYHPNNKLIDCAPETDKAKHMKAFSSSSEDDDDDDDGDDDQNSRQSNGGAAAAAAASSSSSSQAAVKKKRSVVSQHKKNVVDGSASAGNNGGGQVSFQDHFRHLFTPSSHYFYAQYVNLDAEREQKVRERFNACPCPTPVRQHPCVYMDCMAFGMGLNCLQVTMQWADISEARHMYDQLAPIAPLMLALSAATPFQKGILVDSDVRWMTISSSVDCRRRDEVPRILKSRYDNVSMYISDRTKDIDRYNDEHVEVNGEVLARIKAEGSMDETLATHFAHLFIRDPLVVFDEMIHVDDTATTVHFENIQSTNWQSLRFKPPPPSSDIGWRVEFRTMEIQMSAFENAAYSVWMTLLARALHKYNVFTTIPMSLVSMNMGAAHMRNDPAAKEPIKYWWRSNGCRFTDAEPTADDFVRLSMDEIFNGCASFVGLVPLVRRYLREEYEGQDSCPRVEAYIELISRRASGKLLTTAQFLRRFVLTHPTYQKDSRLTREIAHDIVVLAEQMSRGTAAFDDFVPAELLQMANRRRGRAE